MSKIDEILDSISEADVAATIDEVLVIDPNTRQINLPSSELTFGVESDTHSERKYFLCPRVVGDNLDLTSCFIRVNFRNANGDMDAYLVDDVTVVDDNILFSWLLSRKVTEYAGQVRFVVCASRPGRTGADVVEWHTTQTNGISLAGLEPDTSKVEAETSDMVAQLLALVESQTEAVANVGAEQVAAVNSTGETVCEAVVATAEAEKATVLGEIEAKGTNTLASIPDDYTALGEAVEGLTRNTAGAIVCEVDGESAYVSDASDNYVQSLRVFGRSTQDGVPSPDAPVEIESVVNPTVTVCGKNLWNHKNDILDMSSIKGWGTSIWKNDAVIQMLKPRTTYTLSFSVTCLSTPEYETIFSDNCGFVLFSNAPGGVYVEMAMDSGNGVFSVGEKREVTGTFTTPSNIRDKSLGYAILRYTQRYSKADGTPDYATVKFENVQLEETTGGTEYVDYRGGTLSVTRSLHGIPVTSGGNYTDSNGQQWICDEVDLERGVYVQRIYTETCTLGHDVSGGRYTGSTTYSANANCITGSGIPVLCNILPFHSEAANGTTTNGIRISAAGTKFIAARYDNVDLSEVTLSYPLANPIETPLTEAEIAAYRVLRTNKPNTTVLNDAGAWMNVEYVADTKLYIDNKIAALVSGK